MSSSFDAELWCTTPIDESLITPENVRFFDKDGYELTILERAYYQAQGVHLSDCLNHICCQKEWIDFKEHDGLVVDHCIILQRYGFAGAAREQLERYVERVPNVMKLLQVKPKWGIDINIDYIADGEVTEVFHIEYDRYELKWIEIIKGHVEDLVDRTDWLAFAEKVREYKSEWIDLRPMEQSDWKAKLLGFTVAEDTKKSI